jgi:hypothetical protein
MLMDTKYPPFKPAHGTPGYDGNAPEFMPARDIHSRDRMTGKVVRETPDGPENVNSTRVRSMHVRKRLTDRQAAAGDRYAADWQLSQAQVIATAGVVNSGSCARSTLADARLDAMTRWGEARAALGLRYCRIVELVVLDNTLLEVAASMMKVHHQRAAERLECGLDALADHYGIGE